jgi:hypothetical protein
MAITNKFTHSRGQSVILKDDIRLESGIKPDLGFSYDEIHYDDQAQVKLLSGVESPLTAGDMTAIEAFITDVQEDPQAKLNAQALEFLQWTDWYVVREQEVGVAIPADIASKRAAARAAITDLNETFDWPPVL